MFAPISDLVLSGKFVWDFDAFYKYYKEIRKDSIEVIRARYNDIIQHLFVDCLTEKDLCHMVMFTILHRSHPHYRVLDMYTQLVREGLEDYITRIHDCPRNPLRGVNWFTDSNIWSPSREEHWFTLPATAVPIMLKYIDQVDVWSKESSWILLGLRSKRQTILNTQHKSVIHIIVKYVMSGSRQFAWKRLRDHLIAEEAGGRQKYLEWREVGGAKYRAEQGGRIWTQQMEDTLLREFHAKQEEERVARQAAKEKEVRDQRVIQLATDISSVFEALFPFVEELSLFDRSLGLMFRDIVVEFVLACKSGNIDLVKNAAKDLEQFRLTLIASEDSENITFLEFENHEIALLTITNMIEIATNNQIIEKIADTHSRAIAKRFPQTINKQLPKQSTNNLL